MNIDLTSCLAFAVGFVSVYLLFKGLRLLMVAGLLALGISNGFGQTTANFLRIENSTTNVLELSDLNGAWDSFIPPNTTTEYHDFPSSIVNQFLNVGDQFVLGVHGNPFNGSLAASHLVDPGWPGVSEVVSAYPDNGSYGFIDWPMDNLDLHPNHENVWASLSMGLGVGFLVCGIGVLLTMYLRMTGGAGY